MKTTSELIQETLGDVNVQIPDLISKLEKSIGTKNNEVRDILEIAKALKNTMESFSESIDEIKSMSDFIDVTKKTNNRLEEINESITDLLGIVAGLNDKINKTNKKIGTKGEDDIEAEAYGGLKSSIKGKTNIFLYFGILLSLGLNGLIILKLFNII